MPVIAVYSIKGGVGKTTLASDLAWRCAVRGGYNTLLWDLDPQGGAGFMLGREARPVSNMVSVYQRDGKPRERIEPTSTERLSILPADDSLRHLPLQLARIGPRRLATMAGHLRHSYDRIVLDCPAGISQVSDQVLSLADVVIVPLPPSPLSVRALEQLRRYLVRHHHRHPPILPVLSMFDARRHLHHKVLGGDAAGWPVVPLSTHLEQVAVRHQPVETFAPYSPAGKALRRLWTGIEAKLNRIAPRSLPAAAASPLPDQSMTEFST